MIVAYVDESGNDDRSTVFAMATIFLRHSSSFYFGNEWELLLKEFGLRAFHATDFYGRRDELGCDDESRRAFTESAVRLLDRWKVKHSAVLIPNAEYRSAFVDTEFHKTIKPATNKWKKPYLQAFIGTVLDLRQFADHQPSGVYVTPVFDRCQEFMGQALVDYRDRNFDGKLGNMQVADSATQIQLQAADFFAWEYRVNAEEYIRTGTREPRPTLGALLQHGFGAEAWRFEDLDHLRKRVEAVQAGVDPETVAAPIRYSNS